MGEISYSPTYVQGFHGCNEEVKQKILSGKQVFKASENKYDWLGKGIYFWESDPYRAQAWAKKSFGNQGTVIGANIRLGVCFDLSNTYFRQIAKQAFEDMSFLAQKAGKNIPENKNPPGNKIRISDRILRYRDKLVIENAIDLMRQIEPGLTFETVRAPFQEGKLLYPGSGFRELDHIHLCVLNPLCLESLFEVPI